MYTKQCPKCGVEQKYGSKTAYNHAVRKDALCRSCKHIEISSTKPQCQKCYSNEKYNGVNNHMFGRTIKDVWRERYDAEEVRRREDQHREKSIKTLKYGFMAGKKLFDIQVKKHGESAAIEKHKQRKLSATGKNNPMYGKPTPKLSGRGIKGYLYGLFFRSLLEMQYIYYCKQFGHVLSSAEGTSITYVDSNGTDRTYIPDFVRDECYIVELKPSSLVEANTLKIQAGKNFYGDRYIVETELSFKIMVNAEILVELTKSGDLFFCNEKETERAKKAIRRYSRSF